MTEREKQNEEVKRDLRKVAADIYGLTERLCRFVDDMEDLVKFHERNTMAMAEKLDAEMVQ